MGESVIMLLDLILRILRGEPHRKATAEEQRLYSAIFLFVPLFCAFVFYGIRFIDRADVVWMWIVFTGAGSSLVLVPYFWSKFVPAALSLILGLLVCAVVMWMSFTGRLL